MVKVAIVEDDKIIRQSLQLIIDGADNFKCANVYETCEALIKDIRIRKPDAVLMDINLKGGMNGIEGTHQIRKIAPDIIVLMLSVHEEDDKIFSALCAGANGYLLKKTSPAKLIEAVKEAIEGGAPMSPSIARKVVEHFSRIPSKVENDIHLSERERSVLKKISEGRPYKAVAHELAISIPTVKFHMGNVYKKLHTSSQSEAVAKALRKGFI